MSSRLPRSALRMLERWLLARAGEPSAPCVFVLGLPRSGTTLVYQYLVHRLELAYFTNGVGSHPDTPAAITHLQRRIHGTYHSDSRSRYGKVRGPVAPREAGSFWGRLFGYDGYRRLEDIDPARQLRLRRTLAAIQRSFGGAPFVNKNVKHLLRVDALSRLFPESLFVLVERELCEVALSVYRARHALLADPRSWWSVRPENAELLETKPVEEQVVGLLTSLQQRLAQDLAALEPSRLLCVDYQSFCREPDALAAEVARRLDPLPWRHPAVSAFEPRQRAPVTPGEQRLWSLLRAAA